MTYSFNLIHEPWIPLLEINGRRREVNLSEALTDAHHFSRVAAANGIETASILRLLLAVLHRTHSTVNTKAWGELWKSGQFDEAVLNHYFETWKDRFDLFDPQRPFYQGPTSRKKPVSIAGFFPGLAADDHFNHAVQIQEKALTPAEAARYVLVAQTFGLSGGCLPSEKLSHKAASWVAGMVFFVEGENLFQTLTSNMLCYDEKSPTQELYCTTNDRPIWEADDPYTPRTSPFGYLDYLTWPARRVWLIPETIEKKLVVKRYVDFVGLPPPVLLDPFKFYVKDEKAKNATGHKALYLNSSKATWRNCNTILRLHKDQLKPPAVLNWIAGLRKYGALLIPRARLTGYGMVVEKQTKVIIIRNETIPLPLVYLDQSTELDAQEDLLSKLDIALQQAEQVASALNYATLQLADTVYPKVGDGDPNQKKKIAHSLTYLPEYWAKLEKPFHQLILDLPDASDRDARLQVWLDAIIKTGRDMLAKSEEKAGRYPKALKAGVIARGAFAGKLRKSGLTGSTHEGEEHAERSL